MLKQGIIAIILKAYMTPVYCCVIAEHSRKETNPSYELTSPSKISLPVPITTWLIFPVASD
jgi:hypothetical protein